MSEFRERPRDIPDKKGTILSAVTLTNNSCKGGIKKGLIDLNVCIEDTSRTSADYFNITKCEDKFTIGSNAVSFQANARMFKPGSEIQVEVLDAHGNAIKHEIKRNTNADSRTRTVCFFVCDDTPTGPGIITFTGIAVLDNNCFCPLPADCQDRINVRWSRKIYIDPSLINDEPIDWYEPPIVKVEERIVPWSHVTIEGQENTFTTAAPTLYHDTSATGSNKGSVTYEYDGTSQFATCILRNAEYTTFYESDGTTQQIGSNVKNTGDAFETASLQWVDGTINFHKWYQPAVSTNDGAAAEYILRFDYNTHSAGDGLSALYGKTLVLTDTSGTAHTFTIAASGGWPTIISALTADIDANGNFHAVYNNASAGNRKDLWITITQASNGTSGNTTVTGTVLALGGVEGVAWVGDGYGYGTTTFSGGAAAASATVAYSYGANQNQNVGRGVYPHETNHSSAPPLHRFAVPSSSNLLPASMSTTIRQIVSQNEFLVDPISEFPILDRSGYNAHHIQRIGYASEGGGAGIPFVIRYEGSEGTVTTKDPDTHIAIDQSYASINIRNLKPCCSEVTHVNVFIRSHHKLGYGDNSGFEFLNVMRLHPTNFMVDKDTTSYSDVSQTGHGGTQFINFGRFTNQAPLSANNILQSYWQVGSSEKNEDPSVTINNTKLIGGVKICHAGATNTINEKDETFYTFKPQYSHSLAPGSSSFFSGSTYQIKFNAYGESDPYSTGGPTDFERGNPRIDIYMSGSSFKAGFNDKGLGKRITSIETKAATEKYINNTFIFDPDNDGTGAPVFVIRRGCWHLADIELTAASGSGLTPSIMDGDLAMPIQPASDVFDFKFEYLNYALIPAKGTNSITYIYNVPFLGTDLNAIANSHANHPSQSNTTLLFTTSSVTFPPNITNIFSTGSWQHTGSMHVTGTIHATELIIGVVSKSMLFASGSSKFGDDCDDTHQFTGSVSIAGNLDITDTLCEGGGNISSSYIYARSASIGEISSSIISSSIISGSYIWGEHITGSLFGTASWAGSSSYAGTASYALHARSASWADSASQATTASYAHWAASASHAVSSSFIQTSSYAHTSSWAMTASYVSGGLGQSDIYNILNTHLTSSNIRNHGDYSGSFIFANSASFNSASITNIFNTHLTSSYIIIKKNIINRGDYSGSFIFANSASFNSASITNLTSSNFYSTNIVNRGNYSGSHIFANSASFNSASITNLTFTRASGSLYGTASWAGSSSQALTASYGRDNDWFKEGKSYADGNEADPTIDGGIYHEGTVGIGDFSSATPVRQLHITQSLADYNAKAPPVRINSLHNSPQKNIITYNSASGDVSYTELGCALDLMDKDNCCCHLHADTNIYIFIDRTSMNIIGTATATPAILTRWVITKFEADMRDKYPYWKGRIFVGEGSDDPASATLTAERWLSWMSWPAVGNQNDGGTGTGITGSMKSVRWDATGVTDEVAGTYLGSDDFAAHGVSCSAYYLENSPISASGKSDDNVIVFALVDETDAGNGNQGGGYHYRQALTGLGTDPSSAPGTLENDWENHLTTHYKADYGLFVGKAYPSYDCFSGFVYALPNSTNIDADARQNFALHVYGAIETDIVSPTKFVSFSPTTANLNAITGSNPYAKGVNTVGANSPWYTAGIYGLASQSISEKHDFPTGIAGWYNNLGSPSETSINKSGSWLHGQASMSADFFEMIDGNSIGVRVDGKTVCVNDANELFVVTSSLFDQIKRSTVTSSTIVHFTSSNIINYGPYSGSHIYANSASFNSASITNLTFTRATGSLFGTASWAGSSSYASTASYAIHAVSASWAGSASQAITASYGRDNDWYKQGKSYSDGNEADPTLDGDIYHTGKVGIGDFSTAGIDHQLAVEGTVKLGNNVANEHNITGSIHMKHTNLSILSGSGNFGIGTANPGRSIVFDNTSAHRLRVIDGDPSAVGLQIINWETSSAFTAGGGTTGGNELAARGPRAIISVNAYNSSASYGYGGTRGQSGVSLSYMPDTFEGNTSGNDYGDGGDKDSEGIRLSQEAALLSTGGNPQGSINIHARGDAGQQIRFFTGNDDARNTGGKDTETQRMTIHHDGGVGIGTHNPQRRLHVSNSVGYNTSHPIVRFETLPTAPDNTNMVVVDSNGDLYQTSKFGTTGGTSTINDDLTVLGNFSGSHIFVNSASINEVSISKTLIVGHVPDPTDTFTNHFISMSVGNISMSGWISSSNTASFGHGKFTDIRITNDTRITRDTYIGRNVYVTNAEATVDIEGSIDVNGNTNLDNTDIDGTLVVDGTNISLDSTSTLNIDNSNTTNGITIGTATANVPIKIGRGDVTTTIEGNTNIRGNVSSSHIYANSASINEVSISRTLIIGHVPDPTDTFTNNFISMSSGNVSMSGWISSSNTGSFGYGKFSDTVEATNTGSFTHTVATTVRATNVNTTNVTATTIEVGQDIDVTRNIKSNGSNINTIYSPIAGGTNIVTVGTIGTGVWNGTAIATAYIANDAIDADKIADDVINSEHIAAGSVDTEHIADNQVTLDKLAGLARGKIIYGNASGDPAVLSLGSNGEVLLSDGTDISWGSVPDASGAQTGITSIKHNSLIIGGNSQNNTIDFGTDDKIIFDIDNVETVLIHSTGLDVHGTVSASYGSFTSGSFNTLVIGSGSRPSNYGGLTLTEISASGNISSSGTIYASTGSIGRVESDALKGTKIFGSGAHLDNDVNLDRGSDARGDILYRGTTDYVRLAGGSANTVLIMGDADPTWNTVGTNSITDNAVTLAKMAGLARGKIIYGDASGDPAALSAGANGKLLVADANGDLSWTTVSGDVTLSAGAITIAATSIEGSMLNNNIVSGLTDIGAAIAATDEFIISDAGTIKRSDISRLGTFLAGDGLAVSSGVLAVGVDDSSIEINSDAIRVKAGGITTAMLADDAVDADKLASNAVVNASVASSAAIAFTKLADLTDGNILIGNAGNEATSTTVSGDVTINGSGVTTIGATKVHGTMLNSDVAGTGLTIAGNNLDIEAAQTGITSIKHNSLILGGNSQNNTIDFGTDDKIIFDIDNVETALVHSTGLDVHGTISGSFGSFTSGSFNTLVIGSGSKPSNYGDMFVGAISMSGNITGSSSATASMGRATFTRVHTSKVVSDTTDISLDMSVGRAIYVAGSNLTAIYSPIAGNTSLVTLGTITTGVWNGTAIAHDYIGADAIDATNIADDAIEEEHIGDGEIKTVAIADDQVTYAKIQNVSATNRILGRDSAGAGVIEEISPADLVTMLGIEASATADQTKSDIDGLGITTVGTIDTGVWNGTAITHDYIGADAIDGTNIGNDVINSEHYVAASIDNEHLADNAVNTDEIADNAVTLDKMAGIARGKIIIGNSSGDPSALAAGTNGYVLTSDGTDISWAESTSATGNITGITSVKHNSLIIGGNSQNNTIDFGTDDKIIFDIDNIAKVTVGATETQISGITSGSFASYTSGSFNTLVIGSGSVPSNYGGLTLTEISASGNISSSGTIYASTGSIGRVESAALKGTKIFGSGAHLDNDVNLDRGSDARGDILYRGSSNYQRLAGGSANHVLIMGDADPTWNTVGTNSITDNAVTLAKMAGLARGKIIVGDSSGDPSALSVGGANTVLQSDGTDATWNTIATAMIADNAVSLAKMAGLARGKIIVGDASGDPSALAAGANGKILVADANGDPSWTTLSGDASLSAGALTIAATSIEGSMLNNNIVSGLTDIGAAIAATDEFIISDAGTIKRSDISRLGTFLAGDGLAVSSGVLAVGVDDSSIEISSDALRVKAAGITNAMLADNAADTDEIADNAVTLAKMAGLARGKIIYGDASGDPAALGAGANGKLLVADANGDLSWTTVSGDLTLSAGALTIGTGVVEHAMLAGDAVDGDNLADNAVDSEHYTDGSIDTAHIADNQITLAKMAGLARGKIIVGDASGDPSALGAGANGKILVADANGDPSWTTLSGDASLSAGALTIAATSVEGSMLNNNIVSGLTDIGAAIAATDEIIISDAGTIRRTDVSRLGTFLAGDGLAVSSGVLAVGVDDSSIEINSDAIRVKAAGITNAMLADNAADTDEIADNAVTLDKMAGLARGKIIYGDASGNPAALDAGANGKLLVADANGDLSWTTVSGDLTLSAGALTIGATTVEGSMLNNNIVSGLTDIGAAIAATDEFIISDAGTIKRSDISRLGTFLAGDGIAVSSGVLAVGVDDSSIEINSDAIRVKAAGITNAMLADNAADTAEIADNAVTLAKLAGLARGKIIYGDSSGDPAALSLGSNGEVLLSDGTDISWGSAPAASGAQTGITTIYNTGTIIGRAANDTTIDFTTDDKIILDAGSTEIVEVNTGGIDITGKLEVIDSIADADDEYTGYGQETVIRPAAVIQFTPYDNTSNGELQTGLFVQGAGHPQYGDDNAAAYFEMKGQITDLGGGGGAVPYNATSSIKLAETTGWGGNRNMSGIRMVTEVNETGASKRLYGIVNTVKLKKAYTNGSNEKLLGVYHTVSGTLTSISNDGTGVAGGGQAHPDFAGAYILNMLGGAEGPEATNPAENQAYTLFTSSSYGGFGSGKSVFMESVGILNAKPNVIGLTVNGTVSSSRLNVLGDAAITGTLISANYTIGGHTIDDIDITSEFVDADAHIMSSKAIGARFAQKNADTTGNANTATALETSRNLQVALGSEAAQGFTGAANATSIGVTGILASANMDADTAHLTTAQTFTGVKTFGTTTKLQFRDANAFINSPTANDIEVAATTITLDAASDIQLEGDTSITGFVSASGVISATGGVSGSISGDRIYQNNVLNFSAAGEHEGEVVYFGGSDTVAGDLYYLNSSGGWTQTDADTLVASTGMLAVACGASSDAAGMLIRGFIRSSTALGTRGGKVYLSTTPGDMAESIGASGDYTRIIGHVVDATNNTLYFNPSNAYVLRS